MTGLPWLRLYTEYATDPKIQILAFDDQRHFVMLLCLKGNGTLDCDAPSESYRERLIAKALGLDASTASEAKRRLLEGGLITADWMPVAWENRQYSSDHDAAERQRRSRENRSRDSHNDVTTVSSDCHATDKKRLDTDTDKIKNPTARKRALAAKDPEGFAEFRQTFPPRSGSQPWSRALRAWRARVSEGVAPAELIAGANRYALFILATGKERTETVLQAATFLGPDQHFRNDWVAPLNKSERVQDSNIEASHAWLQGGGGAR